MVKYNKYNNETRIKSNLYLYTYLWYKYYKHMMILISHLISHEEHWHHARRSMAPMDQTVTLVA